MIDIFNVGMENGIRNIKWRNSLIDIVSSKDTIRKESPTKNF